MFHITVSTKSVLFKFQVGGCSPAAKLTPQDSNTNTKLRLQNTCLLKMTVIF